MIPLSRRMRSKAAEVRPENRAPPSCTRKRQDVSGALWLWTGAVRSSGPPSKVLMAGRKCRGVNCDCCGGRPGPMYRMADWDGRTAEPTK